MISHYLATMATKSGFPVHLPTAQSITRARIENALRFIATIVAEPGGEVYLLIFERLEQELAAIDTKTDALARARAMIAATSKSSPSTPHGA